jgi:hypothetical protein
MSETQQAKYGARPSQVAKTASGNPGSHEKLPPKSTPEVPPKSPPKKPLP